MSEKGKETQIATRWVEKVKVYPILPKAGCWESREKGAGWGEGDILYLLDCMGLGTCG